LWVEKSKPEENFIEKIQRADRTHSALTWKFYKSLNSNPNSWDHTEKRKEVLEKYRKAPLLLKLLWMSAVNTIPSELKHLGYRSPKPCH
jgi:hypothetical protein